MTYIIGFPYCEDHPSTIPQRENTTMKKDLKCGLSIVVGIVVFVNAVTLCNGDSLEKVPPTPWPWRPLSETEILENYKSFVQDLMKSRDLSQINTITYDPFSVGLALAVINEKVVLNVSTVGLDSVLKTPAHKIVKSYEKLLNILSTVSITRH